MGNKKDKLNSENAGLQEKLSFYEELLDKLPGIIYINEVMKAGEENSMRNVYLNRYAVEITGYTREEADSLGPEYFRKVLHPDDFEVINQSVDHLLKIDSDIIYGGAYKFKPKGKDYIWMLARTRVFKRKADGTPYQYVNSAIQLDEEFHAQNQIYALLKENRRLVNEINVLKLTKREKEVLKLLTDGYSAKMISHKINISESTVISHRKNMMKKLNMHSTASLVNFAVENGLN
jgi:DNA-binding CsgD family transcriptional regulator